MFPRPRQTPSPPAFGAVSRGIFAKHPPGGVARGLDERFDKKKTTKKSACVNSNAKSMIKLGNYKININKYDKNINMQ